MLSNHSVIDCGPPGTRPHSSLIVTSTTFQSVAVYACEPGYHMENGTDTKEAVCLKTGNWSDASVNCIGE